MLKSLTISNYALIDHLEFSPALGLNIITGETGAGKSIMMGAIGLLLGNRADTKTLLDTDKKCIIEGEFEVGKYKLQDFFSQNDLDYDDVAIIRREISPSGKSRGFVNDTPVTLDIMRELGSFLVDVHSQNDTLQLGSSSFQLHIIDAFADTLDLFELFKEKYSGYRDARLRYEEILHEEAEIRKEADFNLFLLEELQKASFEIGEQGRLEEELEILSNSEEIKLNIQNALNLISSEEFSILSGTESLARHLNQLAKYSSHYSSFESRIESVLIELNDIRRELEIENDKVEHDPGRINEIQGRLSLLYQLLQKHQTDNIEDLLKIKEDLDKKVDRFQNLDEEVKTSKARMIEKEKEALIFAKDLSTRRKSSFEGLNTSLAEMLTGLGMPNALIKVDHQDADLYSHGVDSINILFSANKGIAPQPLKQVASGGEFSRLMFCIKYLLARKTSLPTLIFDEIDAGVSGEIALKLGGMMREMSGNHQVISISHLPQMAAKAEKHFFVYKDNNLPKAVSKIRCLNDTERVEEIAKMIAGDNPTSTAFASARELLEAR